MGFLGKVKSAANEAAQKAKESVSDIKPKDITANLNLYEKYFSESELWQKIGKFGKSIGATVLYPVFLLFNLLKSGDIDLKEKALIIGTLGYFILPLDLIPDMIPALGFTDDAAALALAYKAVQASVTPEIEAKAQAKVDEWFD